MKGTHAKPNPLDGAQTTAVLPGREAWGTANKLGPLEKHPLWERKHWGKIKTRLGAMQRNPFPQPLLITPLALEASSPCTGWHPAASFSIPHLPHTPSPLIMHLIRNMPEALHAHWVVLGKHVQGNKIGQMKARVAFTQHPAAVPAQQSVSPRSQRVGTCEIHTL